MIRFLLRVKSKLGRILFPILHKSSFLHLGQGSFLYSPFRLDGGMGVQLGEGSVFQRGSWLYCGDDVGVMAQLNIGRGCVFGYNNHITSIKSITIGNDVLTANNVYISDNMHDYEDVTRPVMHQPVRFKKSVVIGDGCWIGENACILGAHIGKNCVIGANAVVTKDIPDYSVAVGMPARVIRQYDMVSGEWKVANLN